MRADTSEMIAMPIAQLRPGEAVPFPLYLHLPRNERMVAICEAGDPPPGPLLESARLRGVTELWVPREYQSACERYVDEPPNKAEREAPKGPLEILRETGALLEAGDAAAVGKLASAAVSQLFDEGDLSGHAREQAAAACRAVADALLARRRGTFFESVRTLRSLQPCTHHSVIVGSLAAALHAARGGDPDLGAELAAAGTLHDIGLSLVPRGQPANGAEYEAHVETAVSLLTGCSEPVPERVIALVRDHHERQDRTGFPSGVPASKLQDGSELLIMANVFDDLCTGHETGTNLSPREAYAWLRERLPAGARGGVALTALGPGKA